MPKDDFDYDTIYARERSGTGWFVGIIVALALLAIGYLVFSAGDGPCVGDLCRSLEAMK